MNTGDIEKAVKCCISGYCTGCPRQAKEYPSLRADCKDLLFDYVRSALRAQQERENPKPLTLEELRERAGKYPVFCVDIEEDLPFGTSREWAIEKVHEKLVHRYVWRFDAYGKTWLAYGHEPKEGTDASSNGSILK